MDFSYDQQGSGIMDPVNRTGAGTSLHTTMLGDNSFSTPSIDPILNRVSQIEDRLNASDSIYRLSAQANAVKDRERREQIKETVKSAQKISARIDKATEGITDIPNIVNKAVEKELEKINQAEKIKILLEDSRKMMATKLANFETITNETNKKTAKSIKKINTQVQLHQTTPVDDSQGEEIQAQINELKRYQDNIMSLIKTAMQHNDQDYAKVANDLNDVWSSITRHDNQ